MKVKKFIEKRLDNLIASFKTNSELKQVSDCEFYEMTKSISEEQSKEIIEFFEIASKFLDNFVRETNEICLPNTVNFHGNKKSKYHNFSIYIRRHSIHILIKK